MYSYSKTPLDQNVIKSLLQKNALFSGLNDDQIEKVLKYIKINDYREGEVIFHHGDEVHGFYFVVSGIIKLYRQSPNGHEKIIELKKAGQTFAEALMFFDHPCYPVSAIAIEKSTAIMIKPNKFLEILKNSTPACFAVMGALSHRLHDFIKEIDKLSLMTGRNRVAMYFLDQAMTHGLEFKLEIPKNAIASKLSLQPETFSRLIKELNQKMAIEINESRIKILNKDLLRKYAGII